jgi:hypothetical protein
LVAGQATNLDCSLDHRLIENRVPMRHCQPL